MRERQRVEILRNPLAVHGFHSATGLMTMTVLFAVAEAA
jgi:hypothetical protein